MSLEVPELPNPAERLSASGDYRVRYEDISQDGRLRLEAVPQGTGPIGWRKLLRESGVLGVEKTGVLAIPSRFIMKVEGGPLSVMNRLDGTVRAQLAHCKEDGEVSRIILNFSTEIYGKAARTHDPQPENAGERILAARMFTEHVWTKLFAPPGQRRVTALPEGFGIAPVPEEVHEWRTPQSTLDLPAGARWLDADERPDEVPLHIGLVHTDSNHHVNSLTYPRLFEEAGLRWLAAHGRDWNVLGTYLDMAFARPCFAGERLRIHARAFELDGQFGLAARLLPDGKEGKARCFARLLF